MSYGLSSAIAVGMRFGKLVVQSRVTAKEAEARRGYWLCLCDCGRESRITISTNLLNGSSTSCGKCCRVKQPRAPRAYTPRPYRVRSENLAGDRFGALIALSQDHSKSGVQGAYWHCRCDCGAETVARAKDLKNGNTASCGCLKNVARLKGSRALPIARPWDGRDGRSASTFTPA